MAYGTVLVCNTWYKIPTKYIDICLTFSEGSSSPKLDFTRTMTLLRIIWILPMMAVVVASVLLIVVIPTSSSSSSSPSSSSSTSSSSSSSSSSRSLYYQRYKFYPPYCSTPEQMSTRNIPPLRDDYYVDNKNKNENNSNNNNNNNSSTENDNSSSNNNNNDNSNDKRLIGETRLVHVTAIIRHGARTPWSNEMKCWEGFWDSPDTGIWDCDDLTTFMTSPSRNGTTTTSTGTGTGISTTTTSASASSTSTKTIKSVVDPAFFLFEKRYDALNFPNDGLTNALNGTCQMGQLLQQGYDQQIKNGKLLRDAYTYKKGEYDHDERMRLLDISLEDYLPWETNKLYFRADDDQRTIMSGQVLLRGLFDPELIRINNIDTNSNNNNVNGGMTNDGNNNNNNNKSPVVVIPLHIADRDKDIMDANDNDCPKLDTIKDEARQSPEYQKFMNSQQSQDVRQYAAEQMGIMDPNDVYPMDCLMCTICTDRPLPNATNDYDSTKNNWFSKLVEYEIQQYTILMKYNNAQWAKLALGPLWYEIMKNINPYINEESNDDNDDNIAAPRLALFAGHDTTLMPLLASLGSNLWNDTDWPSYASMILIEIHELIDGRSDPDIYTSKFAFRLIYNGKILTSLVDGCHDDCELCDIVHLKSKLDPIATRDKDCSEIKIPTTSTSSTTNDGVGGSSGDDVPEGVTDISSVAAREESFSSFLLLSTTTGIVIFVSVIVLSGLLGSSFTFLIMRRFSNNNNNNTNNHSRVPVDYGDAWDINTDDNNDDNNDDYSFERTTSESRFRDELPDHDEF